jgi:hypothetical protein
MKLFNLKYISYIFYFFVLTPVFCCFGPFATKSLGSYINYLAEFIAPFHINTLQMRILEPNVEKVTKRRIKLRKWKF